MTKQAFSTAQSSPAHSVVGKPSKPKKDKKLGKKNFKAAADGSTAASSYGVYASVSLLGAAAIGTEQTPKSDWPAGPAQATTASVGVTGLLTTGAVTTTAEGDDFKDTAKATASVAGLGTGTGLQALQAVSADVVGSSCTGTGAGVTGTTTVTGLKLAGIANTAIPANPDPNTVLNIAGLGTLTLNEQTRTTTGGKTKLVINALHLRLLGNGGILDVVGSGDVIAGHTECTTTNSLVPSVSGIAPTTGPTSGGTSVVITGTNFRGTSDVKFDGVSAQFTVDSPTQITAISPAHAAGAANVTVTTPGTTGGTNTGTNTFTYVGAPTVTGINPANGPPAGGTTVTLTGTGFSGTGVGAPTVKFGNTNATGVTVNSPTSITATAPSGTGTVFVTVTTNGGTSAQSADNDYTYVGTPSIGSLSPTSGPITGGTSVTVTGTNFTTDSTVSIGGTTVTPAVNSGTSLTFTTPAHAAGNVNVTVTNSVATSSAASFTYQAIPIVLTMTPVTGSTAGGTAVTITGVNLDAVTQVQVDGATVAGANIAAGQITFNTPAHAAGAATVTLVSPSGTTAAGTFLYADPLPPLPGVVAITGVSPDTGPLAGGTTVTLTGVFLASGNTVKFGNNNATGVTVNNLFSITATAPAGDAPGAVPVTVTNASGTSLISVGSTYTYTAGTPTVGSISPTSGPATGGTDVTLSGTNFTSTSVVYWDNTPLDTEYVNGTTLKFSTPPGSGPITVTVRNGSTASTTSATFTYNPVPTVTGVSPLTGPVTGGTEITVSGTDLNLITSIQVGSKTATKKAASTATSLVFDSPANSVGAYTITLSGSGGTSLTPGLFVYTPVAAGSATVVPASGPIQGGNQVTITGTGFSSILALTVGAKVVTNYTVTGDTQLTFTMPSGLSDGTVPVIIATAGGIVTLNYTYVAFAAAINGISPITGPTDGGTQVTITGTGFTGATGVRFGGTAGTGINVNAAGTQITITAPPHAAGLVNVVIVGPGGVESSSTALFTYLPVALAPTVTAVTPAVGPVAGGTQVTISGTGFLLANNVTFGGSSGSIVSLINATTIVVTTPAHAVGDVNVIVTTPLGSSAVTAASKFTYVANNTVPVIDTMTPRSGPTVGGTTVVFRGLGLDTVDRVTFDGAAGTDLNVVDETTLTVKTPAHAAGGVAVLLRNTNGNSRSYLFTYVPLSGLPTVSGLTPNVGPAAGGTQVTISGTGFDSVTEVTFDGVPGTDLALGPDVDDPAVGINAATRDKDLKAVAFKPALAKKAVSSWKAAASNTLKVNTPAHPGGPTTVVVTNSAGSISFVESFTFIPVLAPTATINTSVALEASKAVAPKGPSYSGIEVTACSTPDGLGSVEISSSAKSCVYTASDRLGNDRFVMSVIDDLGQTSEQTVNVTVVSEGGGGTDGGGGNDTGDGDGDGDGGTGSGGGSGNNSGDGDGEGDGTGSGSGSGNDTGGGLAFTGTPLLLVPALALGLVLLLLGAGLLGVERFRIRRGGSYRQPATDEEGRQLMPAGLFGPQASHPQFGEPDPQKPSPDDVA